METATDYPDINERLWGKLRASFDGLDETLQQMFLDSSRFFQYSTDVSSSVLLINPAWTLGSAKIAWRAAYDCQESVLWKKLVDLSLVYDGKDNGYIRMHEQLLSLGRKMASEPRYSRRITTAGPRLLQIMKDCNGKGVFSLRTLDTKGWEGPQEMTSSGTVVKGFTELRYLHLDYRVSFCPDEVLDKLVLLDCRSDANARYLLPSLAGGNLAVLSLYYVQNVPTCIGSLPKLRILKRKTCEQASLPEEFGSLTQLQELYFVVCPRFQTLPASFGDLSSLRHLEIHSCHSLQGLTDSFGNLSALKTLLFEACSKLQALPDSFGKLSSLKDLKFHKCYSFQAFPDSFRNLSVLQTLHIQGCVELQALPDSFGKLSSLKDLKFHECYSFQALPGSIGKLSSLKYLIFHSCHSLRALPDSFGNLVALEYLEFVECMLEAFPNTIGNLSALFKGSTL